MKKLTLLLFFNLLMYNIIIFFTFYLEISILFLHTTIKQVKSTLFQSSSKY